MSTVASGKTEDRIATAGRKAAQKRFKESRNRIRQAIKRIEKQVEGNGGVYPLAGGRITIAEVLRCAGKSEAYLRKDEPYLVELKDEVQEFVDRANKLITRGSRSVRRSVFDRVQEVQAELNLVRQAYAEAELEHSDSLAKLEAAEKMIEELRTENLELRKEISDKTVVQLSSKRQ